MISDATCAALSELRRFRHFKRYYFSFDYDWDRLELVRSKYLACRGPVRNELAAYCKYSVYRCGSSGHNRNGVLRNEVWEDSGEVRMGARRHAGAR